MLTEKRKYDNKKEERDDVWLRFYNLFGTRINYGQRRNNIYSRVLYKGYKGKMPLVLTDGMIKSSIQKGTVDYCVSFSNIWCRELEQWLPNCKYALLDIDDTSPYFNNLDILTNALLNFNIKIVWYKSTIEEDGKVNGYHGYIFFKEEMYYQRVAAALRWILEEQNGIKLGNGIVELFPNVKSNKTSSVLMHRLPCGNKYGTNITQFICDSESHISEISKKEIEKYSKKYYSKQLSIKGLSRWSRSKCKSFIERIEWTGNGQTQDIVYVMAYYGRKEEGLDKKELKDKLIKEVPLIKGYSIYCGHTHEIEKIIDNKVDYVIRNVKAGWQSAGRVFTKRINNTNDTIEKIKSVIEECKNINQLSKAVGKDRKVVKKYLLNYFESYHKKFKLEKVDNNSYSFLIQKYQLPKSPTFKSDTFLENDAFQNVPLTKSPTFKSDTFLQWHSYSQFIEHYENLIRLDENRPLIEEKDSDNKVIPFSHSEIKSGTFASHTTNNDNYHYRCVVRKSPTFKSDTFLENDTLRKNPTIENSDQLKSDTFLENDTLRKNPTIENSDQLKSDTFLINGTNAQRKCKKQIEKLSLAQLKSVFTPKGNLNISAFSKLLNRSRLKLPFTRSELTTLIRTTIDFKTP